MRKILPPELMKTRLKHGPFATTDLDGFQGAFVLHHFDQELQVISCDGTDIESHGWEHVSVLAKERCPTWAEMCYVKQLFWGDDETVIQLHPKKAAYKNLHPYVLHMWKMVGVDFELPPTILV